MGEPVVYPGAGCERKGAQPPSVREGSSDLATYRLRGRPACLLGDRWFSTYSFTTSRGAPPHDTTAYDGDQKWSPRRALVTSGQSCDLTLIDEIVFNDITNLDSATLGG